MHLRWKMAFLGLAAGGAALCAVLPGWPLGDQGGGEASFAQASVSGEERPAELPATEFYEHVRVGAVEQAGYVQPTGEGTMSGFDAEYTYQIANVAGFEAEFVSYPNYGKLLEAVENHEVDMALGVARTQERIPRFLFTDVPFAKGELSLRVRANDARYEYGSLEEMQGMRIGVPVSSSMASWTRKWTAEHGLEPPVDYPSLESLEEALYAGEVDGVVVADFLNFKETRVISQFVTDTYHPIFPLDGQFLKTKVDSAMRRINADDPLFESRLRLKYKGGSKRRLNTAFTPEERKFILSHPRIIVAVLDDNMPYFKQKKGEAPRGIIPSFFEEMSGACGMEFVYKPYRTYEEAMAAVQTGEADIVGITRLDVVGAKALGLILASSYYSQNLVSIQRDDTSEPRRLAVAASELGLVRQLLSARGEEHEYLPCRSVHEAFNYFQSGNADALVCGMETAAWLLNHNTFANYTMVNLSTQGLSLSSAMLPGNHPLASILSKSALSDKVDMEAVMLHSATSEMDYSTSLRRLPLPVLMLVFGVVLVLVATAVGLALYSRMQREKARAAVAESGMKAAEQARAAESAFLANMSHDLRTPLNGILGFAELAIKEQDCGKRLDYLQKISYSGKMMRSLVNDVLDMSKIEGGLMELRPQRTCLLEHFDNVTASLAIQAEQKGLHFEATPVELEDEKWAWVIGDQTRMEQVALNLLSNAIKYTPAGGTVRWESRFIERDEAAGRCRLKSVFSDTGLGMSEEFQRRMFEPFSQEHQHGTEKILGTGLGLAIVKHILDLMGASIEAKSELGKGTSFTVIYDLELAEPPAEPARQEKAAQQGLTGLRLLLCEDNDINAELADMLLQQLGAAEVIRAANGQEGLEVFQNQEAGSFDAILMDLRMPVMDGLTATRAIRALAEQGRQDAASIPIIAMTADAYDEDVERCRAAGMDAHIAKPLDPPAMAATIARCCGRARDAAEQAQ